ncbi:hypothetical protein FB107DRAFT_260112, partial [Schizophyllum commune]
MVRRFRRRICYPCNDGESAASRAAGHWSNSRRSANRVEQDSDSVRFKLQLENCATFQESQGEVEDSRRFV